MTARAITLSTLFLLFCAWHVCAQEPGQADSQVADLPLIEVDPPGRPERLAIFYSGDGGWAELVRKVSAQLAASGVKVVGVNSLRYFWTARREDDAAADLSRLLRAYVPADATSDQVTLIGYSRGADVLPFLVNRMPEALRSRVGSLILIAPGRETTFEIHVANLFSRGAPGMAVMPEIARLDVRLLCLYGASDGDTLCPELSGERITSSQIGTGHHLGGDYEEIAKRVLSFVRVAQPAP